MKKRSDKPDDLDTLRNKIIGLGERSIKKSYYPKLQEQLREIERLNRRNELILESAGAGIFGLDLQGDFVFMNKAAAAMFGVTPEEYIGKHSHSCIQHTRSEGSYCSEEECRTYAPFRDGIVRHVDDDCFCKKDGSRFSVEYTSTPIMDNNKVVGAVVTFSDITERKRIEQEVKKIKTQLEEAQQIAGVGSWESDMRTNKLTWSEEVYRIFNIPRNEFKGTLEAFMEMVHPEDRAGIEKSFAEAANERKESAFNEYRIIRPDGAIRIIHTRLRFEYDNAGAMIAMRGTAQDLTETRLAEEELKLTQFSIDHASISAFLVDRAARILYVNEQACRVLGYTREELLTMKIFNLDLNVRVSAWDDSWIQLKKEGSLQFETLYKKKDGSAIPVEISLNYIAFGGREYKWVFAQDISERKKAEQEFARISRKNELILESAGDGIFGMNAEGNHILINKAASSILGYSSGELMGRHSHSIWHHTRADGSPYPENECWIYQTRKDGISRHVDDEVFWRKDGMSIPVEYMTTPIREGDAIVGIVVSFRDISERKRIEEALRISESRFRNFFKQSALSMLVLSPDGQTLEVNHAFEELWGVNIDDLLGYNLLRDAQLTAKGLIPYIEKGFAGEATELPIARYDPAEGGLSSRVRWVKGFIYPVTTVAGHLHEVVLTHVDVTEMVEAEAAFKKSEERFRTLADNMAQLAWMADEKGWIFWYNKRWFDYTGTTLEEMHGWGWQKVHHPDYVDRVVKKIRHCFETGELWEDTFPLRSKEGKYKWFLSRALPIRNNEGKIVSWFGTSTDITDRMRIEEESRHMAQHDVLTGLPNRRLFIDILRVELAQARRHRTKLAIMYLDLDHFKEINDTLGHEAGDHLLKEVSERFKGATRESDTVARIGGDEFNMILSDIGRTEDVSDIAFKIVDSLQEPIVINRHELHVTTSAGISMYPDDSDDGETLLRYADIAMYGAKEGGRNTFRFYDPSINAKTIERMKLERWLRQTIRRGELSVLYQPQINVKSGKISYAEALVRWNHPERGLLEPRDFIPLAEDTGFITMIDEWVLRNACSQAVAWKKAGLKSFCVTVNLSARQFQSPVLVEMISCILAETGLPPDCLDLEVTESTAMNDVKQSASQLRGLREMGVHIAIHNFGTGYSSVNYLKKLPIERLKIDRSFIHDITTNSDDRAIIGAVTSMAHKMGIRTVAEGVETEEQLAFLRASECDEAQGFLFSRPVPAERFRELVEAGR